MTYVEQDFPVVCFSCGKSVGTFNGPPDGATSWITHGNYGSTLYDPMNANRFLEIHICDDCLRVLAKRVVSVRRMRQTQPEYRYVTERGIEEEPSE